MTHMPQASGTSARMQLLLAAAGQASWRLLEPARGLLQRPHLPRIRQIAIAMPAPLLGETAAAADVCRGIWRLAGHEVRAAGSIIFDHHDAPQEWLRQLHGFGWLAALLQGGQRLWRLRARTLLTDWLERAQARRLPAVARLPEVTALRLIHWTAAAATLLDGADDAFRERLVHGLGWHLRLVHRPLPRGSAAQARLLTVLARAWGTLALVDEPAAGERALQELAEEARQQFLPDGGHVSRSGATLLLLLGLLLPLRKAAAQAGLALPPALDQVIDRAVPMLRMLCHADGGLALFHGVRQRHRQTVAALLADDAAGGEPLDLAPHSGYARLARGDGVAIVDVGAPPAPLANPHGALSALALEFSSGGQRIITGCGLPHRPDAALDTAARASAAHSMAVLQDGDAGTLVDSGPLARLMGTAVASGPAVQARMQHADAGLLLEAGHDAWRDSCGLLTQRRVFLAADGCDLRGEDAFLPAADGSAGADVPFTIRFHLHPQVRASLSRDGTSVLLMLPDRSSWTFAARHAELALEESMLLAGHAGPRRSVQIVLRGVCGAQGGVVNWRLHRNAAARRRQRRRNGGSAPSLPLEP